MRGSRDLGALLREKDQQRESGGQGVMRPRLRFMSHGHRAGLRALFAHLVDEANFRSKAHVLETSL